MSRHFSVLGIVSGLALLTAAGCRPQQPFYFHRASNLGHYVGVATDIEYPDTNVPSLDEVEGAEPPLTLNNPEPKDGTCDLSLEESIRYALENGTVIKNLGGVAFGPSGAQGTPSSLLQNPALAPTTFLPALEETNARTGVEAALAAFDTQFSASLTWDRNDTPQNTASFVQSFRPRVFQQDLGSFQATFSKIAATGTQWSIRHNVNYEWNNVPSQAQRPDGTKLWSTEWDANVEAEFRHPFLQGGGVNFNRIAGPGAIPGFNNGVVLARLRVDQSLADFEAAVRNYVADVERAYWNLYYAYRRLDAAIEGRDRTLLFWQGVATLQRTGSRGGEANFEAQARAQFYQFEGAVQQAQANLYKTESILRYLIGLAASDGRLLYPTDKPTTAPPPKSDPNFEWSVAYADALVRSVELRKQRWHVKQAELELIAAKNWLLPRLDAVGRYRWLGMGEQLIDPRRTIDPVSGWVRDAYGSMTGGDFQEWHLGLEFRVPLGFRREMSGVRFAQLSLTRERKVLQEQELELQHQLADAFREVWTAYETTKSQYDRVAASEIEVQALDAQVKGGKEKPSSDLVLQAYRRKAEAEDAYYRSLADYNLAIMQLHFRKGSLLEYDGVYLAEGPWPAKAYFDARRRARARDAARYVDYGFTQPKVISQGPFPQRFSDLGPAANGEEVISDEAVPSGPGLRPKPAVDEAPEPIERPSPETAPAGSKSPSAGGYTPWGDAPLRPEPATAKGPSLSLAPAAKRQHNGGSGQDAFDLGSLDLGSLAGKAAEASPAGAGPQSPVQAAAYRPAQTAAQDKILRASPAVWSSPHRSRASDEPFATPSSAATDRPAPGWKATQHPGVGQGM